MRPILVNDSYRQCINPKCGRVPNFAIYIEGTGKIGGSFRVATILTCSEDIDEGDTYAREHYPHYAREIEDNPPWLSRMQRPGREGAYWSSEREMSPDLFSFLFSDRGHLK